MMLLYSFNEYAAHNAILEAVQKAIKAGHRTGDIFNPHETGARKIGAREMGDAIAAAL